VSLPDPGLHRRFIAQPPTIVYRESTPERLRRITESFQALTLQALVLHFTFEELADRLLGRFSLLDDAVDGVDDGHLDVEARPGAVRRFGGLHAVGDLAHRGGDLAEPLAAAELEPDVAVAREIAGAGEDEVAHPGEAGEGERVRAHAQAEARHLVQASGDERGARVVAKAPAVGEAGAAGDGVLHRAPEP